MLLDFYFVIGIVLIVILVAWTVILLHSLSVLRAETPVAEVLMSPIQSDEKGEFIDIEYTPVVNPKGFTAAIGSSEEGRVTKLGESQSFRVYGDTVGIEGPFIKLHDSLLFLNFKNFYKVSLLEGEYRSPRNSDYSEGSEFEIDGGYDASWWDFNSNETQAPNSWIVDRFVFASALEPGFRGDGQRRYEIVATFDTLTWNHVAEIAG